MKRKVKKKNPIAKALRIKKGGPMKDRREKKQPKWSNEFLDYLEFGPDNLKDKE